MDKHSFENRTHELGFYTRQIVEVLESLVWLVAKDIRPEANKPAPLKIDMDEKLSIARDKVIQLLEQGLQENKDAEQIIDDIEREYGTR